MKGKNKCKLLKQIRRKIAESNDIEFVTSECKFQGDCTGTCPKCEEEVRYLEQQLALRRASGKKLLVAGVAAAMLVGSTGCADSEAPAVPFTGPEIENTIMGRTPMRPGGETTEPEALLGEVLPPPTEPEELTGNVTVQTEGEDYELMGDVVYTP